jgi:L-threonylcarbamoyladenylate synthase
VKTEILRENSLEKAIKSLKAGFPVIFPTETVYGLGALAFREEAICKVFEIKGRPSDNPLIVHVSNLEMIPLLTKNLPKDFSLLAKAFWPGPLTLVVLRSEKVPSIVSGGLQTVAIRMPSHPTALRLIDEVGEPLVAPSANLSGRPSPTTLSDSLEDLDGKVSYAIEGGASEVGIESTVVSLIDETPVILRPGKITKEMLEEVLGKTVRETSKDAPIYSPGMKYRHYAPKATVKLIYDKSELPDFFIAPTMENFYASLREADRQNLKEIAIYCDPQVLKNAGLMNRILRAAGQIS